MNARIEWRGDLVKKLAQDSIVKGLETAATEVKIASNAAAPSESGHLVSSSGTDVDRGTQTASVFYGPTTAPKSGNKVYAIVRHEALRQGGAPKYLERPLVSSRRVVASALAASIRRALS